MTNADKIRQMSDEELVEEIYKLQGNAAACPTCFQRNGKERLKYYLSRKVEEGINEQKQPDNERH